MSQTRYIYYSQASNNLSQGDIDNILSASRAHNKEDHISGLLFFYNNWFMQILEGPADNVSECVQKIKADDRHHDFVEITNETIEDKLFKDWGMASVNGNKVDKLLADEFNIEEFNPRALSSEECLKLLKQMSKH